MLEKSDKKYIQDILEAQMKEYKSFSGAMFEELESQIKVLAEAVTGVMEQVRELTEEMRVARSDLKYKVDREEMILLERRVQKLEHLAASR